MVDGVGSVQVSPEPEPQPQPQDEGQTASQQADPSQAEIWAELRGLIARAKSGDRSTLPRLREFLDRNPILWRRPGDLSLQVQASWITLVSGPNLHMRECTARRVNELKRQLDGDSPPSPMESLLIERVVSAWLRVNYVEAHEAQHVETSLRWAQFQMQRQAVAERQLRAAIDALETFRKASRPINVEIRQAEAVPRPAPTIPKANDEPVRTHNGHVNRINGHATATMSKAANGHNRLNGHRATTLNGNDIVLNGHHG